MALSGISLQNDKGTFLVTASIDELEKLQGWVELYSGSGEWHSIAVRLG